MSRKYNVILLLFALHAGIAYAGTLPLDERNIVDGNVVQDGSVYRIVYYTETYLTDGTVTKKYIVESESDIELLRNETKAMVAEVDGASAELSALYANSSEINELKNNRQASLELIAQQNQLLKEDAEKLGLDKKEVDSTLTSSVVMSPTAFRTFLIVFVLLLLLVISSRTLGIFSRGKEHEKTPYEEEEEVQQ